MSHSAPVETNLFRDLLSLIEHCVCNAVDNGMPRTPGLIEITTLGAAWVVAIIDPDALRWIRVLALSVDVALALAAELLRSDAPPWLPMPKGARR